MPKYSRCLQRALWAISAGAALVWAITPAIAQRGVASADQSTSHTADTLLDRPVTINVTGVSRRAAIDLAAQSAQVPLQYRPQLLTPYGGLVSVHVQHTALRKVLEQILDGTPLQVVADGDTKLVIVESGDGVVAQLTTGTIVGTVTDSATRKPLSSVTVKLQGTRTAVTTNGQGKFTLSDVPVGDQVLTVRVFGYEPVVRTVTVTENTQTTVRVVMVSVPTVLSGVVTTAAGTQRKVEVGNDITAINVDSVMRVAPITTVTDLLETRVPGLTVQHSSGAPGDPSRIRLRGASSITGNNDPIVVVDGVRVYASQSDPRNDNLATSVLGKDNASLVNGGKSKGYAAPSPLDQINPSSIETIEVLKGPSASALYGSDAANGVIVITTKHGRVGPTHFDMTAGLGINEEPGSWPTNYYRFGSGITTPLGSFYCQWNDQTCAQDSIVGFQALNDPRYTVFANHGSNQSVDATVSGGVSMLMYSLSARGTSDLGLIKLPEIEKQRYEKFYSQPVPNWMERPQHYATWSVSGQVTAQPSPNIRATLSSTLFNGDQQNSSLEAAISQLDGVYIDRSQLTSNPLVTQFVERAQDHQLTSTNAVTFFWQARPWLPINATGGINTVQRTDQTLIPYGINSAQGAEGASCVGGCSSPDTTGSYGLGRGTSQLNTLSIGTVIPTLRNRLTLSLGGEVTSQSTADFSAYTRQLSPGVTAPSTFPTSSLVGTGSPSTFSQSTAASSTYGVYVQTQIHVLGSLYLNPGFRLDGGSASGQNSSLGAGGLNGLTGFPKIDLSYLLVDRQGQEAPLFGALTLFRPRLAFGKAGTQPGPTERLRLFDGTTAVSLNGDTSYVQNVVVSTLGNTLLQPERSDELEGGFDTEFWRGRLSLTATQFNKTRHNAIITIPVQPSVNGGGSIYENIGEVRETGTEVSVNAQVLQRRAVSWTVGGNVSRNNNVVTRLNPGTSTIDLGNGSRIVAGYPLTGRWASPIASFADDNQDGIIEGNEVRIGDSAVYVGQQEPKFQMNVNSGLTLLSGRLSINATFAYVNGLTQFNDGAVNSGSFALLPNTPGTPLSTQAAVQAAAAGGSCIVAGGLVSCPPTTKIGAIQTVNTLRFNDLSINLSMPKSVARLFRASFMSVALQGSNLALHSNYRGKDPNVNAFSTSANGDQTTDLGQIPQPRTWWLKFTVSN